MKILSIVLLLFVTATGFSQTNEFTDLQRVLKLYQNHCNEVVDHEVEQTGKRTYESIPVYNELGELIQYKYAGIDTVWSNYKCPEFAVNKSDFVYLGSAIKIQGEITRPVTCKCKRREYDPGSEYFWKWVMKQ